MDTPPRALVVAEYAAARTLDGILAAFGVTIAAVVVATFGIPFIEDVTREEAFAAIAPHVMSTFLTLLVGGIAGGAVLGTYQGLKATSRGVES